MQSTHANVNWGVQSGPSTPDLQEALDIVWVHLEKDLDLRETSSCGRYRDAGKGDRGKEGSQQSLYSKKISTVGIWNLSLLGNPWSLDTATDHRVIPSKRVREMECLYRFIPLLCPSMTDNYSWWCSFHGLPTCHVNEQSGLRWQEHVLKWNKGSAGRWKLGQHMLKWYRPKSGIQLDKYQIRW